MVRFFKSCSVLQKRTFQPKYDYTFTENYTSIKYKNEKNDFILCPYNNVIV